MPLVELRRDWQAKRFARTIGVGETAKTILFEHRKPVELSDADLQNIEAAGGAPIVVVTPAPESPSEKPSKKRKGTPS